MFGSKMAVKLVEMTDAEDGDLHRLMVTSLMEMNPCDSKTLEVACPAFVTLIFGFGFIRPVRSNLQDSLPV